MARFHFDVVEDGRTYADDDGLMLPNAATARKEAAEAAAEMIRDRARRRAEPADVSIIVRDGSPTPVCTVTVALKVE